MKPYSPIGSQREHHASIASTQDRAKECALHGCTEGFVVVADEQTHGRGQFERQWSSSKGGIWFSFVLRPKAHPDTVQHMVHAIAAAVVRVLTEHANYAGTEYTMKLPNDIMARSLGTWKKVCGILTESSITDHHIDWVVMGIGLNVQNTLPPLLRNTACTLNDLYTATQNTADHSAPAPAIHPLFESLLCRINESYQQLMSNNNSKQ